MKRLAPRAAALAAFLLAGLTAVAPAGAAVLTLGTPTATTPAALVDPLGTLPPVLGAGLYLLPVEVLDAVDLQTFGFGITFDADVVAPHDAGGLFQGVYAALFSAADPTPTGITSGGLALPGRLDGVAGFASGADGDGTLAFVLFALAPGASIANAGFGIDPPVVAEVPIPGTAALAALPLLALVWRRRRHAGSAVVVALAVAGGTASAQVSVTANGPYYATPSWDQTITSGRFVVLANFRSEAVLDRETGLVWQRRAGDGSSSHETAVNACFGENTGGRLGWRLPTIEELSSLIDPAVPEPGPKLPPGHPFVLPAGPLYWSSTVVTISGQAAAMRAHFDGGFVSAALRSWLFHVWCVRGGGR